MMNKLDDLGAFLKNIMTTTISDNIKDLNCFKHSFLLVFRNGKLTQLIRMVVEYTRISVKTKS